MSHQCVRCGKFYPDGAQELLKGCGCGGRFFFFVKKKALEKAKEMSLDLSKKDREQIEKDVTELVGDKIEEGAPVVLDLENIRVSKPGKYELDLVDLFKGRPLVYKLEDGKYIIDIVSTFNSNNKTIEETKVD